MGAAQRDGGASAQPPQGGTPQGGDTEAEMSDLLTFISAYAFSFLTIWRKEEANWWRLAA